MKNEIYISNRSLLLTLISLILIHLCSSVQIHILEQRIAAPNKNKNKLLKQKNHDNDSVYSKICNNVFSTYSYMGQQSMDIHKSCKDKYEMLGTTDPEIIKERPICYDNINQFFCNYKIQTVVVKDETELAKKKKDLTEGENKACGNESLIKLVLNIIKGCLHVRIILIKI
jgi:hypothetical protein